MTSTKGGRPARGPKQRPAKRRFRIGVALAARLPALSLLAVNPCYAQLATDSPVQPGISRDISYGPDAMQTLDVCRPANMGARAAAIVMFHGGGWAGGDKQGLLPFCKEAADMGLLAVTANYRLSDGTSATAWPAQADDARAALIWLRAHPDVLGTRIDRVCVGGTSAGAQIAGAVAFAKPTAGDLPPIRCLLDNFGVMDLREQRPPMKGAICRLVAPQNPSECPSLAASASPITQIKSGAPPTMIIQGTTDRVVSLEASEAFQAALKRAGVAVSLAIFPGGHTFVGLSAAEIRQIYAREIQFAKAHL